jgi:hypothetical protein
MLLFGVLAMIIYVTVRCAGNDHLMAEVRYDNLWKSKHKN